MAKSLRKFAVFDIDGTLIRWQLYHAMADALAQKGHIEPKSYQAMRDARLKWKKRRGGTFKDYEKQVVVIYEAMLGTLSFEQFDEAINDVFDEYKDQVSTYTRDLIAKLKAKNYLLFAISGSQTEIVQKVAEYYGFDDYVGTIYGRGNGHFTRAESVGSFYKDKTLQKLITKHPVLMKDSLAIGDSASDAAMLELVEQPIAFNPEKALFELAYQKGWKIVIERKNMIYELEKHGKTYELAKTSAG